MGTFFVGKDDKAEIAETQHAYEVISERLRHIEAARDKPAPASGEPAGASVDEPQDSEQIVSGREHLRLHVQTGLEA